MIRAVLLLILLTFSGCGTLSDFRVSMGILTPYDVAVEDFKQGQVIEARTRLRSIEKGDRDYKKAQVFLRKKVEPARLKLLRYYARKGKKEERVGHWALAAEAYQTAAGLSIQPQVLKKYQGKMAEKVRQLRFSSMYKKRKAEDEEWLKRKRNYIPPKGLLGNDKAFAIAEQYFNSSYLSRIEQTWELAEYFKEKDMPELAWLYADAYLRLSPGDRKAQNLKNAMATALPQGILLPKGSRQNEKTKLAKLDNAKVSVKTIKQLMWKKKWLEAKQQAQVLRKEGNPEADKLLEKIDAQIAKLAEKVYIDGNLEFRLENIDKAVEYWQQAVSLTPNNQTYLDSLRRGKQIQERLAALRREESEAEKKTKIEE